MATSIMPALSLTNFTSCQEVPPSVVLYRPRSGLERHAAPSAATYTTFGLLGCTAMRPMCSVFSSPFAFHVMPPSVDLKIPPPGSMELREFGSPVPAHTCWVSDGAMASMPIEITRLSSNTGRHVVPLLVVFQMPPPAAAANRVLEGPGMPTTSDMRPMKLAGPTVRQRMPATAAESSDCAPSSGAPSAWAPTSTLPASHAREEIRDIGERWRKSFGVTMENVRPPLHV